MNKKIPNALAAAIIGAILLAFGCWAYFGDTVLRQSRRMKLASEYLPNITNIVYPQAEFRKVRVGVGTGAGGCFFVSGMVETEKQLSALQSVIAATKPPVTVLYRLEVLQRYSDANP